MGDQTAAGKIYLDELNRNGSNLSRETLLNSLKITYGFDGGQELREHLADYFDAPEHAAFAIELTTNPRWDAYRDVISSGPMNKRPEITLGSALFLKSTPASFGRTIPRN